MGDSVSDYKRSVPVSAEAQYWTVVLGRLDRLNPGGSYPFPTEKAAYLFATNQKQFALTHSWTELDGTVCVGVERDVKVIHPGGKEDMISLEQEERA